MIMEEGVLFIRLRKVFLLCAIWLILLLYNRLNKFFQTFNCTIIMAQLFEKLFITKIFNFILLKKGLKICDEND